ncbi:MAG: sulfurtransferase [Betaproteobacteria bacterium]|jgi:rhodanese-related sulfurtransferase|nr:sulfurtransferase [Betaproteobacteria bacterium]NBY17153.1 sulfurtransferase [Betaproteobacteria bacterium]
MYQISPTELARQFASAKEAAAAGPFVLDIRETWEIERASIPGTQHLPMSQIVARISELDPQKPVICMCHHGGRSMQVGAWLETQGFVHVTNLTGGIEAWSLEVDASIPRY